MDLRTGHSDAYFTLNMVDVVLAEHGISGHEACEVTCDDSEIGEWYKSLLFALRTTRTLAFRRWMRTGSDLSFSPKHREHMVNKNRRVYPINGMGEAAT